MALLRFRWDQGGRKASDFAVRSTSTGAAEERPPRAGPLLPARCCRPAVSHSRVSAGPKEGGKLRKQKQREETRKRRPVRGKR